MCSSCWVSLGLRQHASRARQHHFSVIVVAIAASAGSIPQTHHTFASPSTTVKMSEPAACIALAGCCSAAPERVRQLQISVGILETGEQAE